MELFQKIQETVKQLLALNKINFFIKIGIFGMLLLAFCLLFVYLRKTKILSTKAREAFDRINIENMNKRKSGKYRLESDSIASKLEKRFIYSRINVIFPFLNHELWILAVIIFAAAAYFTTTIFTKSLLKGFVAGGLVIFAFIAVEFFLSYRNYRSIDNDLLEYLNMLGNFSLTSGEITSVFAQVSKYMHDPLHDVMTECYLEAQTSGDIVGALKNMSEKIEHPKFKEVVKNLEVSIKYSADFKSIVTNNRKLIQDYLNAKQERRALAAELYISMFVLSACLVVAMALMGNVLDINVWNVLFKESVGHLCLGVALGCFGAFFWKMFSINK